MPRIKKLLVDLFDLFSPDDYRFRVPALTPFLSEKARIQYISSVEAALAEVDARRGLISEAAALSIREAAKKVRPEEVYAEEGITGHNVIAQNNVIRRRIKTKGHRAGVHKPATSYDVLDTADAARYRDAFEQVIIPDLVTLGNVWADTVLQEKDTKQIGRTHLQHAEPITYGFSYAWYLSRLAGRITKINQAVKELRGKFSGAVGAYNASYLFFNDPEEFEREVLNEMGLLPAEISTQILPPEQTADLVHYVLQAFTVLANWADDMRNLQRPEIAEVGQPRDPVNPSLLSPDFSMIFMPADISRSSAMPHKANPAGLENIKSAWKSAMPYIIVMYLDSISDNQRDLTNSASQRYTPSIFTRFDYAVRRAARVSRNLKAHPENMMKNLRMSADKIISEPLQILLAGYGHPDAHSYISRLVDISYETGRPLTDIALNDPLLQRYIARFTPKQMNMLRDPTNYLGIASEKAAKVAYAWKDRFRDLGLTA